MRVVRRDCFVALDRESCETQLLQQSTVTEPTLHDAVMGTWSNESRPRRTDHFPDQANTALHLRHGRPRRFLAMLPFVVALASLFGVAFLLRTPSVTAAGAAAAAKRPRRARHSLTERRRGRTI